MVTLFSSRYRQEHTAQFKWSKVSANYTGTLLPPEIYVNYRIFYITCDQDKYRTGKRMSLSTHDHFSKDYVRIPAVVVFDCSVSEGHTT